MTIGTSESALAAFVPCAESGGLRPLRMHEKLAVACGDVVDGGAVWLGQAFLLFYLTAICGLPATILGVAMFASLMIDALMDPLVGWVSDNTRSPLGRRHPYLLGAAIPLFLVFAFLFNLPQMEQGRLLLLVFVVLQSMRLLQSTFVLPLGGMAAELSRDYGERSSIGAYRWAMNSVGGLIVLGLGYGVFLRGDAMLSRSAYSAFGWTVASVLFFFMLICALGTLHLRNRLQTPVASEKTTPLQFFHDMREILRNRSFVVIVVTFVIFHAARGAASVLELHAIKYFWKAPAGFLPFIPAFAIAGALIGVPLGALALRKFEKQTVCGGAIALNCLNMGLMPLLNILHLLPTSGSAVSIIVGTMIAIREGTMGASSVAFMSMLADCANEHEFLTGKRRESMFFAGTMLSIKCAVASGILFGSIALDLIHFPKNIVQMGADYVLPLDVARNLGIVVGPGAAAIGILGAVVMTRYSLTNLRLKNIQNELDARKGR